MPRRSGQEDSSSSGSESSDEPTLPGRCSGVAITGGDTAVLAQTVDLPLELYGCVLMSVGGREGT